MSDIRIVRHSLCALAVVAWAFLVPVASPAQSSLRGGDRVRVTARGVFAEPVEGTFQEVRHDTLFLRARRTDSLFAELVAVPTAHIQRLDRSESSGLQTFLGMVIGAAIGGAVAHGSSSDGDTKTFPNVGPSGRDVRGGMGDVFGLAVGGVIGWVARKEWVEVSPGWR